MQGADSAGQSLQAEVNFYRQNHTLLEAEIRTLIDDNKNLSHQIEVLLRERSEFANRSSGDRHADQDLQNQTALITKERDSLLQLWQTSQRTIEALDAELKTYHNEFNKQGLNEETNAKNRDLEIKFNTALEEINILEKKLGEAALKEKSVTIELKAKEEEIKSYEERGKISEDKIELISRQLEDLKIKFGIEEKNNEDLVAKLEKCKVDLNNAFKRELEAKSKVREALDLLDLVTAQREDSSAKAATIARELAALKATVSDVASDIERGLRAELDEVKEKYDEKVADMLTHVQSLDRELVEKGLLLAKIMRENQVLQKANQHFEKVHDDAASSVDSRLVVAEQKLEAAFQELVASERRNIQLVSEKQCLALDMRRLCDANARDDKRRDWEATLLRTEIADLKLQIDHLQKSLEETDGMVTKLQTLLSSKSDLNQRMVSSKDEEVTALNEHIQKQIELNKKWRQSYVEMTEQLKKRLDELHEENKRLKVGNLYMNDQKHQHSKVS